MNLVGQKRCQTKEVNRLNILLCKFPGSMFQAIKMQEVTTHSECTEGGTLSVKGQN